MFNQEYDFHTTWHRFPKKSFQNGTERRKARQIFDSMKAYFFVDEITMRIHEFLTL